MYIFISKCVRTCIIYVAAHSSSHFPSFRSLSLINAPSFSLSHTLTFSLSLFLSNSGSFCLYLPLCLPRSLFLAHVRARAHSPHHCSFVCLPVHIGTSWSCVHTHATHTPEKLCHGRTPAKHTTIHCNPLQHATTHCNTLQLNTTHCKIDDPCTIYCLRTP